MLDHLHEVLKCVVSHYCFLCWFLNVEDLNFKVIDACDTETSRDVELLQCFSCILELWMGHLSVLLGANSCADEEHMRRDRTAFLKTSAVTAGTILEVLWLKCVFE